MCIRDSANIAGMAALKGLDVVALTDHNTCRNCPAFMAAAAEYGVLAVPGMEINTSEEVHAVCLFPTLEKALDFDAYVYGKLIKFPNREEIFGKQQIYDDRDQVCASEPNLLINATEISFDSLWTLVRSYDGVMFPAHVDKAANSLIANLGFIPPDSCFKTAEVRDLKKLHQLKRDNPYLEQCRIISNSDAHYLEHINEANLTTVSYTHLDVYKRQVLYTVNEFVCLLHDGKVCGEIGVKNFVKAQTAQGCGHLAFHIRADRKPEFLAQSCAYSGSGLNDYMLLRVCNGCKYICGVILLGQCSGWTYCDTLSAG